MIVVFRNNDKNVHAVSERLGYAPNKHAKQLRGSKIQTIGVILPSLTNPFFSALMQVFMTINHLMLIYAFNIYSN